MKGVPRLLLVVGALLLSLSLLIPVVIMGIYPIKPGEFLVSLVVGITLGTTVTYLVVHRKSDHIRNPHDEKSASRPSEKSAEPLSADHPDLTFSQETEAKTKDQLMEADLFLQECRSRCPEPTELALAIIEDCSAPLTRANRLLRHKMRGHLQLEQELRDRIASLERSNRDLEQFACLAAHDLREPLLAVTAYLKLLGRHCREKPDQAAMRFVTPAIDAAKRMDNLVEGLLNLSQLESTHQPFQPADSRTVLENALSNLKAVIDETQAQVTYEGLPTVAGDPTQLLQLFQNLLGNALKFRRDQPPKIHVSASHVNGAWQFSVRDNGLGIEPESCQEIFQMFQRGHTGGESPGFGIGLASCKKIVERHGGRIWVESKSGSGSTFFFTIPEGAAPHD